MLSAHRLGAWAPFRQLPTPLVAPAASRAPQRAAARWTAAASPEAASLLELEPALAGMSPDELHSVALELSRLVRVDAAFGEEELPDQSFLLSFRAAVSSHLGPHAAASAQEYSAAQAAARPARCTPQQLAAVVEAIGRCPVQVVQPLPIGFGTPRWARPVAAADPAAWEAFLADAAAVWAALLDEQLAAAAAAGGEAAAQAEERALQQVAGFIVALACAMRWCNVNTDDDKLQASGHATALACLQQQLRHARHTQHVCELAAAMAAVGPARRGAAQQQQQQQQAAAQALPSAQALQQAQAAEQPEPAPPRAPEPGLPLCGRVANRLVFAMLLLLLPPPRPLLAVFFDTTRAEDFDTDQLLGLSRGLLYLGAAPSEAWLRGLVGLVRARVSLLNERQVQLFVEAFRFFGTRVRAPWLRDATSQLSEWVTC